MTGQILKALAESHLQQSCDLVNQSDFNYMASSTNHMTSKMTPTNQQPYFQTNIAGLTRGDLILSVKLGVELLDFIIYKIQEIPSPWRFF